MVRYTVAFPGSLSEVLVQTALRCASAGTEHSSSSKAIGESRSTHCARTPVLHRMLLWQATSHDASSARSICTSSSGSGGDGSGVQLQVHGEEPQLVVARGRGHCGADANGSSMASALNPRHKTRPPGDRRFSIPWLVALAFFRAGVLFFWLEL